MKSFCLWILGWVGVFLFSSSLAFSQHPFELVQKLLEEEGHSKSSLSLLFSSMERPAYRNVVLYMKVRESALNYNAFLKPNALERARQFWRVHEGTLERIGANYQVDPSIIVAILLIESSLGENTGKQPVATTLATFALMLDPQERERIWNMLSQRDRLHWTKEEFHAKLEQRALWALNELRALITLIEKGTPEAVRWRGSYMAAIGLPQFLPSSIINYGADGDGDRKVDLTKPEDAFASIANYLKSHGWKDDAPREYQEEVILKYNKSRPYAMTVLEVAKRLQQNLTSP